MPIVLLYLGLFKAKNALLPVTVAGLLAALVLAIRYWDSGAKPIYHGMMLFNNYSVAFASITIVSTILILLLSKEYFEKISSHVAEYYAIILFSLAGIIVMVSYYNLTMLFVGIEIMSVSLYILAGIKKNDFASNEAALKYFLMGAFSTGFLLFGIALIYGASGSFSLDAISKWVVAQSSIDPMFYTGIMLMIVGLCFKVGAAPFHFWTPDVYEGSPTLITAYMSTVAKTAAFAAFLRLFSVCFAPAFRFLDAGNDRYNYGNHIIYRQYHSLIPAEALSVMLAFSSISHAGYLMLLP